jgi:hypothetical protein
MGLIFLGRQGLPGEKSMDEMLSLTLNGLVVAALILAAAADMGSHQIRPAPTSSSPFFRHGNRLGALASSLLSNAMHDA